MKPSYQSLKSHHYSSDEASNSYLAPAAVYSEIGYDIDKLIKTDPGYANTCAVRMSLALVKCHVHFHGRLRIKKGPHKGKMIEQGAKRLAVQLGSPHVFGKPNFVLQGVDPEKAQEQEALERDLNTRYPGNLHVRSAIETLSHKRGLIFFDKLQGYNGGHIDLLEPYIAGPLCHSHCYWSCKSIWFWLLE